MQIIPYLIIVGGFSYVGYGIGAYYIKRERFMLDIIAFCKALKVQIGFSSNTLKDIVENIMSEFSPPFKQILKSYLKVLKKYDYVTVNILSKNLNNIYLEEAENNVMLQLFNFLGKSDSQHQIEAIDGYLYSFNSYLLQSRNQKIKYAGLYKKLGFFAGVLVCIIVM